MRSCWTVWHQAYPQTPKGNINDDIEEQGPVQGWCQEIRLFAKAATMAGKDLNRRTFVEAMSRITDFPGGYSPVLSYGPDKFSGPTQYQVVEVHDNHPPTSLCKRGPASQPPAGVCWVVEQNRSRLRHDPGRPRPRSFHPSDAPAVGERSQEIAHLGGVVWSRS